MKIIVDAFGGDNAPDAVLQGCVDAVREQGVDILLCGDEEKLRRLFAEKQLPTDHIAFLHAPEVVEMEDNPSTVVRAKKNSSMMQGLYALSRGEGDAFVSGGSTGALLSGATLIVKRIRGVKRAALSFVFPSDKGPVMLLDCGANAECKPEYLTQFGVMGSVYAEKVLGVNDPTVGLVNIGTEETKGTDLQREALAQLKTAPVNFIGNLEPREIPNGGATVVVADGFTGNVIIKTLEGMISFFGRELKGMFYHSFATKLAALVLKGRVTAFKKRLDPREQGGAPLLGIRRPVFKAHGNSNPRAFQTAIAQAARFAQSGTIDLLTGLFADAGDGE